MQGDLADTSVVDLCLRLAEQATTGTFVLSTETATAELAFVEGRLAGGRLPMASTGHQRLGDRLVAAGRLDPADLDAVLAEQAASPSWVPLGQRLVDAGLVGADVVRVGLQEQALGALQEVVGWLDGSFRVEATPPADGIRVAMPVDRALREVAHRTDARRQMALQAVGHPADRESTAPSREEFDLSASPTTGARPVGLTDDGWADRLDTSPPAPDEPEPWVGWADAERHAQPAAPTPAQPQAAPVPQSPPAAAQPPPAASQPLPATPAPTAEPEPAAPQAHTDVPSVAEPAAPQAPAEVARPSTPLDAETRRELFSELHEMGRPTPARPEPRAPATPQVQPPAPPPEPEVEPEAEASDDLDITPPAPPPASLSRSDVSELLAELHALNLDDDGR